jgi:hypothetical protein
MELDGKLGWEVGLGAQRYMEYTEPDGRRKEYMLHHRDCRTEEDLGRGVRNRSDGQIQAPRFLPTCGAAKQQWLI